MNIYVRKNSVDLFKYLSKEEIEDLNFNIERIEVNSNCRIEILKDSVYIIKKGLVTISLEEDKKEVMTLSEGEIFGEESVFENETFLSYFSETSVDLERISLNLSILEESNSMNSKINAALNDSLVEKLIRINEIKKRGC